MYGSRQVHFLGFPTASDFNLRQQRTSDSVGLPTISDSVGLQSPTASDYNLRQRRTTISDSVGDSDCQRLASYLILNKFCEKVVKGARTPDDLFQMLIQVLGGRVLKRPKKDW